MELNIVRDNGEIKIFNAYRVQHDNSRGPFKGGFRFSPQVTMDEVRRLLPWLLVILLCISAAVPMSSSQYDANLSW